MTRWQERLLAALLGAASVLTYAPFAWGHFSFGWLAPLPLAWLFSRWLHSNLTSPKQAAWLGFAYGAGAFVAGIHWIFVSLSVFGGMPAWMAATGTFLFALYLALFPALAGWVAVRWMPTGRWLPVAWLSMCWIATEWLRGWLFTGFPWLGVGFSQTDTLLAGFYPLGGVLLVSLLVAMVAGWLTVTWLSKEKRWLAPIAILYLTGGALGALRWTQPVDQALSVSLLQGNIPQDLKWNPAFARQSLDTYQQQLQQAKGALKVLPETALPLFFQQAKTDIPAFMHALRTVANRPGQAVLIGAPEQGARWDEYYNSAVLMQANHPDGWYRKVHLVPLGEYLPLKPLSGWLLKVLSIPLGDMSSGQPGQAPLRMGGHRLAVNICYEDVFGTELLASAKSASILINMSNLAWFGNTIALDQHLQIARVRALENGRPMIRATNTGATAVIDAKGQVMARLPYFKAAVLESSVVGMTGLTPYQRLGGNAWVLVFIVGMTGLVWRARRGV